MQYNVNGVDVTISNILKEQKVREQFQNTRQHKQGVFKTRTHRRCSADSCNPVVPGSNLRQDETYPG
jgi:hypothetical protein